MSARRCSGGRVEPNVLSAVGDALSDRVGLRGWQHEHRCRNPAGPQQGDGGQVAGAVRRASTRRDSATSPGPVRRARSSDDLVEQVIVRTLESKPTNATHWSTRSMAQASGMSQSAVSRIWRAFGLKPHKQETFKLSTDPQFVEKVRDIVGLYMDPPEQALVLCVDEKTPGPGTGPVPAGDPDDAGHPRADQPRLHPVPAPWTCSPPSRSAGPTPGLVDHLHQRPTPGGGVPQVPGLHRQSRSRGPRRAPGLRQPVHPQGAHGQEAGSWPTPVFHLHFTPTSSSWLNLVERWFAEITLRTHPPRRTPLGLRPSRRHHRLGHPMER